MMAGIGALTLALALAPAVAIVLILLIRRPRAAEALNLAASAVSLLAILLILASRSESSLTFWGSYVVIDGLGTWTILCAAIVYFLASLYAVGYMRLLDEEDRLYRFYAMFAGFGLSTLIGPMMNNAGLYWIAIELTTLISTFLVAFEREAASIEAAWKYIIVVSAGISLALLGHGAVLLERHVRPRANLRHDLEGPAGGRASAQSRGGVAVLSSRADRLRHEGRSCADAYVAAGRA